MADPMAAIRATEGDFGSRMRHAREQRGVSLRQIADATKISVSQLEALERNDVSRLPGGIFSRAFVRSYADERGRGLGVVHRDVSPQNVLVTVNGQLLLKTLYRSASIRNRPSATSCRSSRTTP